MTRALHDPEQGLRRISARIERALRPAMGQLHRGFCLIKRRGRWDTLVEHHHDVAADGLLHGDAAFRREQMQRAVDIAAEARAVLLHRTIFGQGKNLEPAGVGQHRAVPVHEAVNTAELAKYARARPQQQVVGVGEQHPRAGRLERLDRLAFDRGLRAHRHEDRSLDLPVQRLQTRRPGLGTGGLAINGKREAWHGRTT